MNYLAHGIQSLSNPWFLAGTATPDWLSVADRKVRMRERLVRPYLESDDERISSYAAGILQHLQDDQWFHSTAAFYEVTSEVAGCFRRLPNQDDGFLPGFLGHITTELLLDRLLMERFPGALDEYYRVMSQLPSAVIQKFVNTMAAKQTNQLVKFIEIFNQIQFLRDYLETPQLLRRLNQVLRRVKLQPLPDDAEQTLDSAWEIIKRSGWDLLPPEKYSLDEINIPHTLRRTTR